MFVVPHTECLTLYKTMYTLCVLCYTHRQHWVCLAMYGHVNIQNVNTPETLRVWTHLKRCVCIHTATHPKHCQCWDSVVYSVCLKIMLAQCQHGGMFASVVWCVTYRCQFRDVQPAKQIPVMNNSVTRNGKHVATTTDALMLSKLSLLATWKCYGMPGNIIYLYLCISDHWFCAKF